MDDMFDMPGSTGRTMASVLAETILQDIVTGVLAPGSKLKIRELADRYWVMSRGEIVAGGAGSEMESAGVRELIAV